MIRDLFSKIIDDLLADDYLSEFKFRRRDTRFIKNENYGYEAIELQYWSGYDLQKQSMALEIRPLYSKRFNILHKWFEKYSFKTLRDQRDSYTIGFTGNMLGDENEFFFSLDEKNLEEELIYFKNKLRTNANIVFSKFVELEDLFDYQIIPVLTGKVDFPKIGADWIFEYLALCRIVDKQSYIKLKEIILERAELMKYNEEPNIVEYYPNLGIIIKDIEELF